MQYLLTYDEYTNLKHQDNIQSNQMKRTLQEVCTYAADEVPIKYWGRDVATPWGCILSTNDESYCDECPVEKLCPYDDKQWSK